MRVLFSCFVLMFLMVSCKTKQDYYHGIIFDEHQKPLSGVIVTDSIQFTISDEKGCFRLNKNPNLISNLTFSKEGFKTTTIKTVGTQSGEFVKYRFLNKVMDTLVLKKKNLPKE